MKVRDNETLRAVLSQFSIAAKNYTFSSLNDGLINDTYLVHDKHRPCYILQRVNALVFKNIAGVMHNIKNALHFLSADDYSKITLVSSKQGDSYVTLQKEATEYWRMLSFIEFSTTYNNTTKPEIAFEAGRIIARFHDLLKPADISNFQDTILKFHDLRFRKQQFIAAFENAPGDKIKHANKAICFANRTLTILSKINFDALKIRVCHNDTKLNNILFSKDTGKALCLIDLDTLMKGYFLYDFGDAVRTVVNAAAEDEQNHAKITFDKIRFEAFITGLATHKTIFSPSELDTMAWGAVIMPFLHGLRALTDYLHGNVYYKVTYENQNLDRSLSLFNFTQKAINEVRYMEGVIKEKLG